MKIDEDEVEMICEDCNGYLHSVSRYDVKGYDYYAKDVILIKCPMVKSPTGKCTGQQKIIK